MCGNTELSTNFMGSFPKTTKDDNQRKQPKMTHFGDKTE